MKTKLLFILCASSFATFSQQELIQNGSFEQGEVSWDFTGSTDAYGDFGACVASDGDNYLWFGDFDELTGLDNIFDEVYQDVQLPANLNNAQFSFYWSGGSDEQDDIDEWDFLYFGINDANGDEIYYDSISNADMDVTITAADCDPLWYAEGFTIPAQYAGQTITVFFTAETDDLNPTLFRVDEVSILATTTGVGITENVISNLVVGPNPASDAITVKNLSTSEMDVVILNSEGKEMSKTLLTQGENEINISALSSGIYFIKEMNGLVTKLIKQ
jgi:hypothetical protein